MDRRSFLQTASATTLAIGLDGCAFLRPAPPRRSVRLVAADIAWDRIIRTTVGLRPYRKSGFVVRAERFDDRTLIHNYGHGGAGMSLSWGTAHLVADLALEQPERRAAVIGCGIIGLSTARMLQRRGFVVTIYAGALPPETTSNMSWAAFTPMSGLVQLERRTAAWDAQFQRAVELSYQELQLLAGRNYGVSWIDLLAPTNSVEVGNVQPVQPDRPTRNPPLPAADQPGGPRGIVLRPGEHPFVTRYARRRPTLRFEPSIYLDALMRDVIAFGGRIVVRSFDAPRDLMTLSEPAIVNCTGLGSRNLFGDQELEPVKGQLVVLVPQPEVNYIARGMHPRSDGIVLGHTRQPGVWSLDVDEDERQRVIDAHAGLFGAIQTRTTTVTEQLQSPPVQLPPVESFFDLTS